MNIVFKDQKPLDAEGLCRRGHCLYFECQKYWGWTGTAAVASAIEIETEVVPYNPSLPGDDTNNAEKLGRQARLAMNW